jgi:hypothetical protein
MKLKLPESGVQRRRPGVPAALAQKGGPDPRHVRQDKGVAMMGFEFPEVWIVKENNGYLFKDPFEDEDHSYSSLEEGLRVHSGFVCHFEDDPTNYINAKKEAKNEAQIV